MSKVSILTLGCKQNKYESDCMANILISAGFEVVENLEFADIYIINTCAVTSEAEKKSRQYIKKCTKLNPNCKIIVCGCASENNIEQFKEKDNVFSVFGTEGKEKILEFIENPSFEHIPQSKQYCSPCNPMKTTTREYLKIQDGCNNFCSYCLIPYLRGRSRSRDIESIVKEAYVLASRTKEIVLTGIDISSFKVDGELALPALMKRLSQVPARIGLGSLEVGVITEELLQTLKDMPNFIPHFHLSLQSGDDEILKKMNRHYSSEEFLAKVLLIKEYFPLCNLTTDVIVGFGAETQEQFENTKKFIEQCGFSYVHIFPYSKRSGTRAYTFDDLDMSIKKARVDELEMVNQRLKEKFLSQFLGKESIMLAEEKKDFFEGFSKEYIRCYADDELISGEEYKIYFDSIYQDGMKVKIIKE
ncbi:MAG: tRNA (N(6)-L-threonylcarbamoyladenosine(37)-C(2))-methylthiotransferase MtaB [Clostridia bacterium]|nr:tRNA (N(6)-L-threonylcarbamoyladenosine(37)-C(2))-methylthiotransferase MtaB [Clostridia bacterium]